MKKAFFFSVVMTCMMFCASLVAQPVASFTPSDTEACAPENITFINTSTNCTGAVSYYWEAGNGDISNNENPTFNYSTGGVYTVSLTIICDEGSDTQTQEITIFNSPVAYFDETVLIGCVPYDATFNDLTTLGDAAISEWQWYFGDGYISNIQNPEHTYSSAGSFNVSLMVTDLNGCTSQLTENAHVLVKNQPVVDFSVDYEAFCWVPYQVQFFSDVTVSAGGSVENYEWDFGDGTTTEYDSEPFHSYTTYGSFDVSLTVTDSYGCITTIVKNDFIQAGAFLPEYSIVEGNSVCVGSEVHFVNETILNCRWDFGDGVVSYLDNPTHIYNQLGDLAGAFTMDPGGPCENTTVFHVYVEQAYASFSTSPNDLFSCSAPFTVNFINNSSSNATEFFYQFQDGTSSTLSDPSHTFNSPGIFIPSLTVATENGCFDTYIGMPITINSGVTSLTSNVSSGCAPLTVEFEYNGATPIVDIVNYNWNFDNGQTISSGTNLATSTFGVGQYTVTLTITDENDCESEGTLDVFVGEPYSPTFDVFDNNFPDYTPLPDRFLCAQDTVAFYVMEWDDDQYDFGWWIDSTQNIEVTQEYTEYAFDQDTGWHYLHIFSEWNGCQDTIFWNSFYVSGPIVRSISLEYDCASPRDIVFSVDNLNVSNCDWEIYNWSGSSEAFLSADYFTTDVDYPFSFPASPDSFWLRVTARNDTTACIFVDSLQIIISSPQAIFAIINDQVCASETLSFNGALSTGNIAEYYWDYGDGSNSGWLSNPIATHSYSSSGNYMVTLTVHDINGCESSMSNDLMVIGAEIYVMADVTFGYNSLQVTFIESVITDDPISWMFWEFGDGDNYFGMGPIMHNYTEPGVYTLSVLVQTISGCETSLVLTDYITVVTEPLIELLVIPASELDVADGAVQVTVTGGVEPYEISCSSSSKQFHSFTDLLPGNYTINVEDAFGHTASQDFVVSWGVGITDSKFNFSICPNPATIQIVVQTTGKVPEIIQILNIYGQIVMEYLPDSEKSILDISEFNPGLYFVAMRVDGKFTIQKLIFGE